jgi:HPt (histidine-containing phosphotransfer) domain-containing protein
VLLQLPQGGSSPPLARRLLSMYLRDTPNLLRRVQDACVRDDATALRHALHELKSTSGSIGALELQALAAAHETRLRQGQAVDGQLHVLLAAAWSRFCAAAAPAPADLE